MVMDMMGLINPNDCLRYSLIPAVRLTTPFKKVVMAIWVNAYRVFIGINASLGQFQVLITVTCTWNNPVPDGQKIPVEGILLTPSSGIFETNSGTSSAFVGVLTKEATLRAKETEHAVMGSAEWRRLVGGKGLGSMGVAHVGSHIKHQLIPKVVDKLKSKLPSSFLERPAVQRGAERIRNRLSSM